MYIWSLAFLNIILYNFIFMGSRWLISKYLFNHLFIHSFIPSLANKRYNLKTCRNQQVIWMSDSALLLARHRTNPWRLQKITWRAHSPSKMSAATQQQTAAACLVRILGVFFLKKNTKQNADTNFDVKLLSLFNSFLNV